MKEIAVNSMRSYKSRRQVAVRHGMLTAISMNPIWITSWHCVTGQSVCSLGNLARWLLPWHNCQWGRSLCLSQWHSVPSELQWQSDFVDCHAWGTKFRLEECAILTFCIFSRLCDHLSLNRGKTMDHSHVNWYGRYLSTQWCLIIVVWCQLMILYRDRGRVWSGVSEKPSSYCGVTF